MRRLLAFLRGSLHTIVGVIIVGVVALYMAAHFNLTGLIVEHVLEEELGKQMNTKVTLDGNAEVDWLNQVVLNQLTIYDQQDDTLLYARRVMIAFDLPELLFHHLVLNTCQVIDFEINAYKETKESPANYQFAIDAFKQEDPDSKPFIEKLDLNAILLRQGDLNYDVKSESHIAADISPIDPNHIHIRKLSANVHVHDEQLLVKKFHCEERKTQFKADYCNLVLNVKEVMQSPSGENRFLASLKGLEVYNDQLTGKADANCTSDVLTVNLRELDLPYGHPRLKGIHELHASTDLRLTQLKQSLDSLYFNVDLRELNLRADTLGLVKMTGIIHGMPCHANMDASVNCDLGEISLQADVENIKTRPESQTLNERSWFVQGHCKTDGFALNKILSQKAELGNAAMDADFKVLWTPGRPLDISLNGDIAELEWKEHTFHDITLDAESRGKWIKGNLVLNDTLANIDATFDVDLNHKEHHYKIDGNIEHFNPQALHLTNVKVLDSLNLSGQIHADVLATSMLQAEGAVHVNHPTLEKGDHRLELEPIDFEGTSDRGVLRSPLAHIDYQRDRKTQEYHVQGNIPVANELWAMLKMPFRMDRICKFDLCVDSASHILTCHAEVPSLNLLQGRHVAAVLDAKSNEQGELQPVLTFLAGNASYSLEGSLKGHVATQPQLDIELDPTTLLYNRKKELKVTGAHIQRNEEGDLIVKDFAIKGDNQSIAASGTLGKNGDKRFVINLDKFALGPITSSFGKGFLTFGGNASGNIVVNSKPTFHLTTDSLLIQDFTYVDTLLGNACLSADYEIGAKKIGLTCDIATSEKYKSHVDGYIQLGKNDSLDLRFDTDHLPAGFINNWTGEILQQMTGTVTGKARLYGAISRLQIVGEPEAEGTFTHYILGAHFHFKDKIKMEPDHISLNNVHVDDCHGHIATVNAKIRHKALRRYWYDVSVDIPDQKDGFLVLDRQEAPGRYYWGELYAKGHANLKGSWGNHRINVDVTPMENSVFYLSPYEQDIDPDQAAYTFLTFRDKAKLGKEPEATPQIVKAVTQKVAEDDRTDLRVYLKVNATEKGEVRLKIDPLSDDLITARGHGDLSVLYDPSRDITLAGVYHITEGNYLMTMKGNLMSKTFQLQNTSSVSFNGVPTQAELSLNCLYSIPSVNLNDLDESITSMAGLSRNTVPVDCKLNVTGQLSAPKINFDFELKNVSDNANTLVHNVIGEDQTREQEVLYLLLFSKFYAPQYAQSTTTNRGSSELTSLASSSITSQINQLLGRVSNNFTMGTNVRSDKGDFSDVEMDVSVSTRLLGDRLQLSGNVGYRDPANRVGAMGSNTNSFIGDFDLEWLINATGTVRAKAYSHYNERDYTINNALTTQGIGFILRKDFKRFPDLWRFRKKAKKEDKTETKD